MQQDGCGSTIRHFRDEFEWHVKHPEEATKPGAVFMREGASWTL
jgi:NADH-quinone oxidoreductase subunit F